VKSDVGGRMSEVSEPHISYPTSDI